MELIQRLKSKMKSHPRIDGIEQVQPASIRIEASSFCQLKCPSCPTAQGEIKKSAVGSHFLSPELFEELLVANPWVKEIELSNWGEIFLNPEILQIIKLAHKHQVRLIAANGVNFNNVSDEVLEALVKYKFGRITFSIDGATPEVYAQYRKRGDLNQVYKNIKKLNEYKKMYGSKEPEMTWQFILFEHNKHELELAEKTAEALGMYFYTKISWDQNLAAQSNDTTETESETIEKLKDSEQKYYKGMCHQLWKEPQINADGKVLGCCTNFWGDFGRVSTENPNLLKGLNSESIVYARKMLMGQVEPKPGIPCTTCTHYKKFAQAKDWVSREEILGSDPL